MTSIITVDIAAPSSRRPLVARLFDDEAEGFRTKVTVTYVLLLLFNAAAWATALVTFRDYPVLLGTALLAYTFGLRHAVDADHIAAIDNVTRKLMHVGKRPLSVGLFFSLGHSTVVIVASILVALLFGAMQTNLSGFKAIGGIIGTSVSALFLLLIAAANIVILISVVRMFNAARQGHDVIEEDLNLLLAQRGLFGRMLRSLFNTITKSWHMYPLGILFGLGFDTATEIGLLGISAAQGSQGLPLWSILIFPALFTAAMTLVDTTDGVLMIGAYGWAFVKPIRKLYYNMTITFASVVVALVIGGVEGLGLIGGKLELDGAFWQAIYTLNEDFGMLGYLIIGIFIACWLCSAIIYRLKRYDELVVNVR